MRARTDVTAGTSDTTTKQSINPEEDNISAFIPFFLLHGPCQQSLESLLCFFYIFSQNTLQVYADV